MATGKRNGIIIFTNENRTDLTNQKGQDSQYNEDIKSRTVTGLGKKETEYNKELINKKDSMPVVTKTEKKLNGMKEIENYVMVYSGIPQNERAACGVTNLLHKQWKSKIVSCSYK